MTFCHISKHARLAAAIVLVMISSPGFAASPKQEPQKAEEPAASIDWAAYMAGVEKTIKGNWHPSRIDGLTGSKRTVLHFQIMRDGKPTQVKVAHTSGSNELDQEAQNSTLRCSFKPLPAGAPDAVDIEFTYDYHARSKSPTKSTANKQTKDRKNLKALEATEDNFFRCMHGLMRILAAMVTVILLFVQTLLLIVFVSWVGIEHLKLRFAASRSSGGSGNAGNSPGKQSHEQNNYH